jgi:Zn finger protein HypA/HybF involved in hydrogenase expression
MGIQVECPNGHVFKVKDKYAGKKGLCPHCEGQVIVVVPDALSLREMNDDLQKDAIRHRQAAKQQTPSASPSSSSVFDDSHDFGSSPGTSGSLLGSSVIRHNIKCGKCGERVPMWYARCPHCGDYLEH